MVYIRVYAYEYGFESRVYTGLYWFYAYMDVNLGVDS